ncbi:MAG TPA: hypothetical protein VNU19_07615 [Candidatus Acidoferrum sp.]|jgi:hypothetical protein|nr:hypothetical protein [Candidatus Acidoferrum sp.]
MNDLRSEIRAAFEKEQAAHPPIGGLRSTVTAAAAAQTRPARNLQWIAVAIAAVLGILVVAGLASSRLGPRASVPGNSKVTPVADYGPPPAGVPLVYLHDPNDPSWLIGYDWSGQPRGTVKLATDVAPDPSKVEMVPDGSGFEVGTNYKGDTGVFLDRLGRRVAVAPGAPDVANAIWADDNRHQCVITFSSTGVWGLATQVPGQALHPVAVIARDNGVGQNAISLAACSFQNNLAIAERTVIAWPAELWVIRLSDGVILAHRAFPPSALSTVVASPDGVYLAENSAKGPQLAGADASLAAPSTIILRISDWQVVDSLDPYVQVFSFSGDGSQVLFGTYSANPPVMNQFGILAWRTNNIAWRYSGALTINSFTVQPGGSSFALAVGDSLVPGPLCTPSPTCPAFVAVRIVEIVHADGSTTVIPGGYMPAW